MTPPSGSDHTERSTLAACIAHVAGAPASDVALDPEQQRAWLGERGRGLVLVLVQKVSGSSRQPMPAKKRLSRRLP